MAFLSELQRAFNCEFGKLVNKVKMQDLRWVLTTPTLRNGYFDSIFNRTQILLIYRLQTRYQINLTIKQSQQDLAQH